MKLHTLDLDFKDLRDTIAAFVLEGPEGLVLIETGPYSTFQHLETALAAHSWSVSDIGHVFLSHIHFDHAGAAWALARAGATIHVHPKGLPHLANPEKLYNSARMIYGDDMDRLWGAMEPIPEAQLRAPEHGETIEAAGMRLTAWYTPGHAVHHIAWQAEGPGSEPVLFTGDVAGVHIDGGPVMPPCPPPDINVEDWLDSLKLLRELPVQQLYLTHFGKVADKAAHLDALEEILIDWAAWMRPWFDAEAPAETIIPHFQDYVREQLLHGGVDLSGLERYEAANPAFMSVAGLLRYWKKKNIPKIQ